MRPFLRLWTVPLLAAILFVAGLFWLRAHPGREHNPLEEAAETLSEILGMQVEVAPAPGGPSGLVVKQVRPDSVAERAGVQVGERVAAVGDRSVWHAVQLQELISEQMRRNGSCTILLSSDTKQGQGRTAVRRYRTVTLGFAPVAPPPEDEHSHH